MKTDPFYQYLKLMHRQFLQDGNLKEHETKFVLSNIQKHRKIRWLNGLCLPAIVHALWTVDPTQMSTVIVALLAPVMVMGGAWFAVSFGAVPSKLISVSMSITFWMFTAFKLSFTTMCLAIGFVTPASLWPVIALVYVAVDISCTQYDTTDGLKAGLDEAMLKHSRAAIMFYQQHGIDPTADPNADS